MTACEIEKSGIYNATKFAVTLKNGDVIQFRGDLAFQGYKFFEFSAEYNVLQAHQYIDVKGLRNQHIAIKGEDIVNIEVVITKEEAEKYNANSELYSRLILVILILIGLYMSCHK